MSLARIQKLPSHVAEKIAAGEVIERPFSVVKELVENSLDAGASEISISLIDGGKTAIEVTDNGSGMSREDLMLCVERHATSKLRQVEDFDRLRSLGFRGEALPSVRAVSDLEIVTRSLEEGSESAWRWWDTGETHDEVSRGKVESAAPRHFLGSAHGTSIRVGRLFYNFPVRLKFMKSERSETSAVREWVERLALSHPKVGFTFNGKRWAPSASPTALEDRFREILLDSQDTPIEVVRGVFSDGEWTLYWARGSSVSSSKNILQRVNGRILRDRLLQPVLMGAFRQHLLPGQYPVLFLSVEMDPSALDVNIHPTKTEVRFLRPHALISDLHRGMGQLLGSASAPNWVSTDLPSSPGNSLNQDRPDATNRGPMPLFSMAHEEPAALPFVEKHPLALAQFRGIAFATFGMFEKSSTESLWLVDQHAAHERIHYERLQARPWGESQALLIPFSVQVQEHSADLCAQLAAHGFEVEPLSETTLVFRALPHGWISASTSNRTSVRTEERLKNFVERLIHLQHASTPVPSIPKEKVWDQVLFEVLASEACHSSIRAGDHLSEWEFVELVDRLFETAHPWNCPHGRPTMIEISKARFEEWFQRKAPRSSPF